MFFRLTRICWLDQMSYVPAWWWRHRKTAVRLKSDPLTCLVVIFLRNCKKKEANHVLTFCRDEYLPSKMMFVKWIKWPFVSVVGAHPSRLADLPTTRCRFVLFFAYDTLCILVKKHITDFLSAASASLVDSGVWTTKKVKVGTPSGLLGFGIRHSIADVALNPNSAIGTAEQLSAPFFPAAKETDGEAAGGRSLTWKTVSDWSTLPVGGACAVY